MAHWKYMVPEICPHGVDQRYKFYVNENGWSRMERNWCLKCLSEMKIDLKNIYDIVLAKD